MASENYIIRQVEEVVEGAYREWMIGITNQPIKRKAELGNSLTWLHWKADSDEDAKNVKHYFFEKGMQVSGGEKIHSLYVYILRADH